MKASLVVAVLFLASVVAGLAPLLHSDGPNVIPGAYIVILKSGIDIARRDAHINELKTMIEASNDVTSKIGFSYSHGGRLMGFSAKLSPILLKAELAHPDVQYVEADSVFTISDTVTQTPATWGLDRVDQHNLPLNNTYFYNSAGGAGVDVYVIDTGILTTHVDFGGRASAAYNSITYEPNEDLNGHGTHCAGTIGGTVYGVAKLVSLYAVKVLDSGGGGTASSVTAGVDWVTNNQSPTRPSISSMSLGGGASTVIDASVSASIASGVSVVVAGGNSNANACNYSPARVPTAVTVGSTTNTDARSSFSNFGTCTTIFAPGSNIVSDYIGSDTATATLSGTSMATPHVAGAIALYQSQNPALRAPAAAKAFITSHATGGVVGNPGTGSPNLLLYTLAQA